MPSLLCLPLEGGGGYNPYMYISPMYVYICNPYMYKEAYKRDRKERPIKEFCKRDV